MMHIEIEIMQELLLLSSFFLSYSLSEGTMPSL